MPVAAKPTLLQAVKTLFASAPGVPTLWMDQAPEGSSYPRAVLRHLGEEPVPGAWDVPSGQPIECTAEWEFELAVENDPDAAEALAIAIMQTFRPDALQLTIDPTPRIFRGKWIMRRTDDRSPAAKPVYTITIPFKAMFGTNY